MIKKHLLLALCHVSSFLLYAQLPNLTPVSGYTTLDITGSTATVSLRVENNGGTTASYSGTVNIEYYLSADTNITDTDYYIGSDLHSLTTPLAVGDYFDETMTRNLSTVSNLPDGTYYLGVIIDVNDELSESNENDNFYYFPSPKYTRNSLPNLTPVSGYTTLDITGSTATVSLRVENNGGTTASYSGTVNIEYYLSADTNITDTDYYIGSDLHSLTTPLAVGDYFDETMTRNLSTVSNLPDGTYYLGVIIDVNDELSESNENDNFYYFPSPKYTRNSLPNLTPVSGYTTLDITGSTATVSLRVENNGGTTASYSGTVNIEYYLSADTNITDTDYYIGSDLHSLTTPLAVGDYFDETMTRNLSTVSNLPDGTYYLGVIIDVNDELSESNENDNFYYFPSPKYTRNSLPNLTPVSGYTTLDITGSTATVSLRVENNGGTTASYSGTVNIEYYLSADTNITDTDYYIGSDLHSLTTPLAVGDYFDETMTRNLSTVSNLPDGTYYLGVIIDVNDELSESNENDNFYYFPSPKYTRNSLPNLTPVSGYTTLDITGSTATVSLRVENNGGTTASYSGTVNIEYYLSADTNITDTDYYIGSDLHSLTTPLAVGDYFDETMTRNLSTVSNLPDGTYYLGVIIDVNDELSESNENDNFYYFPSPKYTRNSLPNLTPVSGYTTLDITGSTATVSLRVENNGGTTASYSGTVNIEYYLSADTNITDTDYYIGSDIHSLTTPLAVGDYFDETMTRNLSTVSNLPDGTYYLGVIIDVNDELSESNENDNFYYFPSPKYTRNSLPNLTPVSGYTTLDITGSTATVSLRVENNGGTTASYSGTVNIEYYLSADTNITDTDYYIGSDLHSLTTPLAVGDYFDETMTRNLSTVSNLPDGAYYLGVIIDVNDELSESNENDNFYYFPSPKYTRNSLPNLTPVSGYTTLDITGSTATVSLRVENNGGTTASYSGTVNIEYYLSADTNITDTDYYIGSDLHSLTTPLAVGDYFDETMTRNLSTVSNLPDGAYYLGVIIDVNDELSESNENDNFYYFQEVYGHNVWGNFSSSGSGVSINENSFNFYTTITNDGFGTVDSSAIGYYLSEDGIIYYTDYLIGSDVIDGLIVGESDYINTSFVIDTSSLNIPDGIYYVGFILDYPNDIVESDETDNTWKRTSAISFNGTLKIEDKTLKQKNSIYPNPTSNYLFVKCNNFEEAVISDLAGKKIFKSNFQMINLEYLNAGVYIIEIKTKSNEIITSKIVKK